MAKKDDNDDEGLAKLLKELAPMMEFAEHIRSKLNAEPLDWTLESPEGHQLLARRTITVPGLGDLGVISFSGRIAPEKNWFSCYVRSMATPYVLDGTEMVDSVETAMHRAVETMIVQAGVIREWHMHMPRRDRKI